MSAERGEESKKEGALEPIVAWLVQESTAQNANSTQILNLAGSGRQPQNQTA
jgi:hypothetical protein